MKPILYESTEQTFASQGIGVLSDALSCTVTEAVNGVYEAEFKYSIDGIHYDKIRHSRIFLAKPNDSDRPQPFTIYRITRPINGIVTVYGEHIRYRMGQIPVQPFTATSVTETLYLLPTKAVETCPFTFWTDKTTVANFKLAEPKSMLSVLGGTEGSILDTFGGGDWKFDRWDVKLYANRGADNGVMIRYGKNLTDINQEENISNVVTGIYPYWVDQNNPDSVVISDVPVYSEYASLYPYSHTIAMDFSQEFQQTQPTVAQLKTAATRYIENNAVGVPDVSIKVSFAALWQTQEYKNLSGIERVGLCDTVTVVFEKLGITAEAKVIKTVYDSLLERYDSIEVGNVRRTNLTKIINTAVSSTKDLIRNGVVSPSMLAAAINNATQLITGGLGGYVVTRMNANGQPEELMILTDDDNYATATKLWRWNKNGFGFSSTGYEGNYIIAITNDGHIVADRVDTGTLNANIIKAGILGDASGRNFWNMVTGEFQLSAAATFGGNTINQIAESVAQDVAQDEIDDYRTEVNALIGNLQDQIDGEINTWYYDYEPTINNYPASSWSTAALKEEHQGDIFYWKSTGYSYRFLYDETNQTWDWEIISDTYITTAIAKAAQAQDTADRKRRIFVVQPEPPYDIGDLWVQGENGDILRCTNPKAEGAGFLATDWILASKYTDDTLVKAKYGTCSSDADVANKVVTLTGFELYKGARITVFFAHSNTADNPTLNVNGTGAIPIYAKGAVITSTYYWRYTDIVDFVYDNSHWEMIVQNQREIFMRLTNGGADQGIYLNNGKVYVNATYIQTGQLNANLITTGELSATRVRGGYLSIGGSSNGNYKNGVIRVYNSNDQRVIQIDTNGIRVGNIESSLTSPNTTITPNGYVQTNRLRATGSVRAVGNAEATERSLLKIPVVNTYETIEDDCYFEVGENGTTIKTLYQPVLSDLYGIRGATLKVGGILQRNLENFNNDNTRAVGGYVCVDTETMSTYTVRDYTKLSPTELIIHSNAGGNDITLSSNGFEIWSRSNNNAWIRTTYILPDLFVFNSDGFVDGDLTVMGDMRVNGAKPRVVKTNDYADRTLYCYETASPLFGDVGEGTINDDGQCYVFIDPILAETIQTSQYQVFLQKYGDGDCYVSERKTGHFVVTGTPGMQFGWEMKAKQFDLTQKRLDKFDASERNSSIGNKINYVSDAENHIIEIMNERMAQNENSNFGNDI